jgi:hypothetical protein
LLIAVAEEADRYRRQAQECREQAANATGPIDKESWLWLADEFMKLARADEERGSPRIKKGPSTHPVR